MQNYCTSSDELFLNLMGYKIELIGTDKIGVPSSWFLDKEFDMFEGVFE